MLHEEPLSLDALSFAVARDHFVDRYPARVRLGQDSEWTEGHDQQIHGRDVVSVQRETGLLHLRRRRAGRLQYCHAGLVGDSRQQVADRRIGQIERDVLSHLLGRLHRGGIELAHHAPIPAPRIGQAKQADDGECGYKHHRESHAIPVIRDHQQSPFHLPLVIDDSDQCRNRSRRAESLQELEDRPAITEPLILLETGEGQFIAGELALLANTRGGKPDQGIEPVKRLNHGQHPIHRHVETAQVPELVKNDMPELGTIERVAESLWQEQHRPKQAVQRRGVDEIGLDHEKAPLDSKTRLRRVDDVAADVAGGCVPQGNLCAKRPDERPHRQQGCST